MTLACALLAACLGVASVGLVGVDAFTMAVYDNELCLGAPLNKTTIEQDKCISLPGEKRPNSGYYVCKRESLTKQVWVGSGDCGETSKGYVTYFEDDEFVGGGTEKWPACCSIPWLETGDR